MSGARRLAVAVAVLGCAAGCARLVSNLSGGIGPESGILRGKLPSATRAASHVQRLTDGIAAEPGDPWRTDLTAVLSAPDASVTWDLGTETPVRCALVDADGNDRYEVSMSNDGQTFTPLWTAAPDEEAGQQLRAGRDLRGAGRYLRVSAAGGDGQWSLSEVSAWSACPKAWPPLAMQRGTSLDEAVMLKLGAFEALALLFVLLYRARMPDWAKLLAVVPVGIGIALALQLADLWPLTGALGLKVAVAAAALVGAVAGRVALAKRRAG
ncbi:MAG: hypothetical protein JWM82_3455 [Myxococcales bacterium]|nr:hypothetical protein [Myxococcales bacterium]